MVLWIIFVIEILDLDFETFHETTLVRGAAGTVPDQTGPNQTEPD